MRLRRTPQEQENHDRGMVRKRCGSSSGEHHWLRNGRCEICGAPRPPLLREFTTQVNELDRGTAEQRHEAAKKAQEHRAKVAKWAKRRGLSQHLK